jgi:hypothetical protein
MAAKRKDWQAQVKGLLKAEVKRRNMSYGDLADKLAAIGVKDNERNISNKIARGSFTAVFFVQCMEAIGCRTIHLEDNWQMGAEDLINFAAGRQFRTILSDPPWRFINRTGKMAPEHRRLSRYNTMTLEEIAELPV